jgi:hypothetical protein
MTRADIITLSVVALTGVGIGWLIPGCPAEKTEPEPIIEAPEPVMDSGDRIRTIEERIEAPDGTVTIRVITYVEGKEAEG